MSCFLDDVRPDSEALRVRSGSADIRRVLRSDELPRGVGAAAPIEGGA